MSQTVEPAAAFDCAVVDQIIAEKGRQRQALVPILQALQEHYHYLPAEALQRVAEITEISPAAIVSVSTFYNQFRHLPAGAHILRVCVGTACHVAGANVIYDAFHEALGLKEGQDTDEQRVFTIEKVACVGCCCLAPVILIDEAVYGKVERHQAHHILQHFIASREQRKKTRATGPAVASDGTEFRIALDSDCIACGADKVHAELEDVIARLRVPARVKEVGCLGISHLSPVVEIARPGRKSVFYANVKASDVEPIVRAYFKPTTVLGRVTASVAHSLDRLLTDETWKPASRGEMEARDPGVTKTFIRPQQRIATEESGAMDPLDLEDYRRHGGFRALEHVLKELAPEQVIRAVDESGLRGRGGAGFHTGRKWAVVRAAHGDQKYVVCNGDEGDPGAFMDRMLLESYPYRVLEGIAIAARAVGATEGYLYVRAEYPLAVKRTQEAIRHMEQAGLLGERILGTEFSLRLHIYRGAGAFVCGEETALIASLEGKRGNPRLRPPYPAEAGLWGKPTLVNNVETYSLLPWIFRHGSDRFKALGTEHSKGTKVFALAGKVRRTGLIEVPMGVTFREIVEKIGGGIPNGRTFKAVQIGGPSGGCIPATLADLPIDYEALTHAGAIMGSGGLVILDDSDCMVDVAKYFLRFTQNESCGKCTFCRIGTRLMMNILDRLCAGEGHKGDLEMLEELGHQIKTGSLCGLGQTAPNPVLSTLRYFREEYHAHIDKRCPAGKCAKLVKYVVTDACSGCTKCVQICPVEAIPFTPYRKHEIDATKCTRCDSCRKICPEKAIEIH